MHVHTHVSHGDLACEWHVFLVCSALDLLLSLASAFSVGVKYILMIECSLSYITLCENKENQCTKEYRSENHLLAWFLNVYKF